MPLSRSSIIASFIGAAAIALGCGEPAAPAPTAREWPVWADIGKSCTAGAPALSLPPAKADSLPVRSFVRHPDDQWASAARVVPGGFGGIVLTDNILTYVLVDTAQHEAAVNALIDLGVSPSVNWRDTRTLPGHWDFAQMDDWYHYIERHLATTPQGLTSQDIDELRNRIQYGVVNSAARRTLEGVLSKLDLPCYLVEIDSERPVSFSKRPRRSLR